MAPPKKPPAEKSSHVYTLRLKPDVAARIEALRDHYQRQTPVGEVTTTDVIRHLVEQGSDQASQAISGLSTGKVSGKEQQARTRKRKARQD
jgi:hypothetical protein